DLVAGDRLSKRHEPCAASLKRTAAPKGVRFISNTTTIDGLAVHAISLVVVSLGYRRIDWNLVEVWATQRRDLGVDVRVDAAGEQRVVGEVNAGDDVSCAEGDLLGLCEKVIGVTVQHEPTDGGEWGQFLGHNLRRVEDVEGELLRLFFSKHLERELPLRKGARFDRFPQIASMKVRVRAVNLDTLIPVERVRTCLGTQVKLDER